MDVGFYFSPSALEMSDLESKLEAISKSVLTAKEYSNEFNIITNDYVEFFDATKEFNDYDILVDPVVLVIVNGDSYLKVTMVVNDEEIKEDVIAIPKDSGSLVFEYKGSYFKLIRLYGKGNMKVIIKAGLVTLLQQ